MKERLIKLVNVKSIVTILVCLVFCYLSITHFITTDQFMNIFTVIVAFYFGTVAEKKNSDSSKNQEKEKV